MVFLVMSLFASSLFTGVANANSNIHIDNGHSKYVSVVPAVITGDVKINNEKCYDDSSSTFSVIVLNSPATVYAEWGCDIVYDQTESQIVSQKQSEGRTRDQTCLSWPRGSSSQPDSTDWPLGIWKQLYPGQFLVVPSGITYYNFTSQSTNTNSINIIKNTTITSTQTVWIWVTTSAKLHTTDPGFEKIQLSPGTQPQEEEQGWIYSSIPAYGFSTGWVEIEINGSFVDFKQSCLNPLVVENNSNNSIRIRYKQTTTSDPYYKRKLVSIYGSGNSLQSIKTVYANEVGCSISHLSIRKIFPN